MASGSTAATADRAFVASADLLLLGTVLLWSFNFAAVKYAVTHGFTPLTYAPIRWAIAGTAFALVTWRREGGLRVSRRDFVLLALLGALGVFVNQICFAYASKLATASTVALLFGTLPVFVALFSQLAGVERLRLRHWIAVGVSFAGVALVATGRAAGCPRTSEACCSRSRPRRPSLRSPSGWFHSCGVIRPTGSAP